MVVGDSVHILEQSRELGTKHMNIASVSEHDKEEQEMQHLLGHK